MRHHDVAFITGNMLPVLKSGVMPPQSKYKHTNFRSKEKKMAYETLIVEKKESWLQITLNRPPVNALNEMIVIELNLALDEYAGDADIRSVIITGAGEKAFCAGADLKAGFGNDPNVFIKRGQDTFLRLEKIGMPA